MKYIIIGSSAAGTAAAKAIRKRDETGKITMISRDDFFFSRCQLHLLASGQKEKNKIKFHRDHWPQTIGMDFLAGTQVVDVDPENQTLKTDKGDLLSYDKLLIATGARTSMPPIKGLQGKNVFGLRDVSNAEAIKNAVADAEKVTIIGAGLVGCELATAFADIGKKVNLVELAPHPLPMQLEEYTGELCIDLLKKHNINVYCNDRAAEVIRDKSELPIAVKLMSGAELETEVVICAAGVRPNTEMIANIDMKVNRGIVIDKYTRTSIDNIYAAGDVTETEDVILNQIMPSAIWPTAVHQGKVAGINMTGGDEILHRNTGLRASVSLFKTQIISIGAASKPDPKWKKTIIRSTDSQGRHNVKVFYIDGEYLKCAILWGDIANAGVYGEAIINSRNIADDLVVLDHLNAARRGTEKLNVL